MREIKFRAWDSINKRFSFWGYNVMTIGKELKIMEGFCSPLNPKFESTQFTGLKDKNGKDIYEGDIVKCFYGKSRGRGYFWFELIRVMEWDEDDFGFRYKILSNKEIEKPSKEKFEEWCDDVIIGNKFENPELLQ